MHRFTVIRKRDILLQPSDILLYHNGSSISSEIAYDLHHEAVGEKGLNYTAPDSSNVDEPSETVDITIKETRGEDGSIFLTLRITDKEGRIRHIHFPFDIKTDTAFDVATEMVDELEIADYGATRIANMINGEVYSLIPEWKPSLSKVVPSLPTTFYDNYPSNVSSNVSLLDLLSIDSLGLRTFNVGFE